MTVSNSIDVVGIAATNHSEGNHCTHGAAVLRMESEGFDEQLAVRHLHLFLLNLPMVYAEILFRIAQ